MAPSRSVGKYIALSLLLFVSCLSLPFSFALNNLNFSYSSFQSNDADLQFSTNSNVDNQALQVTRNSGSSDVSNSSGQITHRTPLQLWHHDYNYSASFNTSFRVNMGPIMGGGISKATGGGVTFLLSSISAVSLLPNSFGQWLGLYDGSIAPDQQQARLVAIELDTFKDSFDPDGNHVGIDVNGSIKSVYAVSLSPYNVILTNASDLGVNTSIWIDYDGRLHTLDVYLANQGSQMSTKPVKPIISRYPIDLSNYLPETVYVGFSASLGTILEAHCVLEWTFTSTDFPHKGKSTAIIIGCSIGGAAIILLVVLVVIILVRRRRRRAARTCMMDDLISLHYGPRKFPYQELKRATKGFSEECKLGQGGFGAVYKGELMSNGVMTEVAVKCLSQISKQGEKEFKAEVRSMGRMRHKNLVQLLGWSSRLMLVYEYMPNKSLDKWIGQGQERVEVMGWDRRYHVMKGLVAGLLYLHEEWEMVVVHRDLKPSNVMLDADFNARIGDFGLAKLINFEQGSAETATIAGTPGYIAPECMEQGIISKEADIYSIGAIAIELVTGRRRSNDYLHSLLLLLENSSLHEAADPRLGTFDPTQLELLLKVGLACCHPHPPARPSIREVAHALSSSSISFSVPTIASFPAVSSDFVSTSALLNDSRSSGMVQAMEITTGR